MDTIQKLFQETIQKTLTTDRISYMVLKKLLSVHGVILSKKQIDQMSKDLVTSGSINIKIKKDQIRRNGFKTEKGFEEYFRSVLEKLPEAIENFGETLDDIVENATVSSIDKTSKTIQKSVKAQMKLGLAEKEAERLAFEYNMYRRWGKALNALEMLILLSFECGDNFNNFFREKAVAENDLVFEVLTRMHARACQVAYEIFTLLKSGYADGAHARWRCLHEITVVAVFIAEAGQETAESYFLHEKIDNYKEALSYNEHCNALGYDPIPEDELAEISQEKSLLVEKYGDGYYSANGWAVKALGKKKIDFIDIEKSVKLDHYRPYYKMACHNVHAGSKGIRFRLGLAFDVDDILLAGPSNVGLFDPGVGVARSLNQLTAQLMTYDPTFDSLVKAKVLNEFRFDVEYQFWKADQKLQNEILQEQNE
jgi:hypothetical protein